ncbi:response regulator (plasmid) [Mesorhizobium loti]|uniref:Response regulator n=1 Tax=Mesorhizobium jarvisii TaxID=1777867 RepID=A0A6M7TUJ1_9HYPH|nr:MULTISPECIES: response regulator [Mesorhizobium]OBQ70235.1 hypothetical protein A9K72_33485 [Mesorhizobium loti]QKC67553.1 response regulator [Mesorhizobium jarvisii]QKD13467.1 response regulator [Mesorhizobium loti]RJT29578.1 response regulator [Mesorhizobium jarvisii]
MMLAPLVLVLEDEELISWDLEVLLAEAGYLVATARSCAQAAGFLDTRRPDVAILDILLSDGQCVDVAKKLRADGVPFIVHSALAPTEVDDAFRSGTFLVKPAGILDIVGAVTKLAAGDQRGTI